MRNLDRLWLQAEEEIGVREAHKHGIWSAIFKKFRLLLLFVITISWLTFFLPSFLSQSVFIKLHLYTSTQMYTNFTAVTIIVIPHLSIKCQTLMELNEYFTGLKKKGQKDEEKTGTIWQLPDKFSATKTGDKRNGKNL